MKVKVIKATFASYWYADKVGEVFEAVENTNGSWDYKEVGSPGVNRYFDKGDVEIINQDVAVFDIKKDRWFICTPTHEISRLVQNWLFDQGFVWQHHEDASVRYTSSLYLKLSPYKRGAFCHTDSIDLKHDTAKEIKLTFKTVIDSVEFPEIESEEQKQLDILVQKIADLQKQAEKLQGIVGK
jgi:hypothetical protein